MPVGRRPHRHDQASDACRAPTPPPRPGVRCLPRADLAAPTRPPMPVGRQPHCRDQASDACAAPTPPPRSGLRCLHGDLAALRRGLRCLDGDPIVLRRGLRGLDRDPVVLRRGLRCLPRADLAAAIRRPMPARRDLARPGQASDASPGLRGPRREGLRRLRADRAVLREGPRWGRLDLEHSATPANASPRADTACRDPPTPVPMAPRDRPESPPEHASGARRRSAARRRSHPHIHPSAAPLTPASPKAQRRTSGSPKASEGEGPEAFEVGRTHAKRERGSASAAKRAPSGSVPEPNAEGAESRATASSPGSSTPHSPRPA